MLYAVRRYIAELQAQTESSGSISDNNNHTQNTTLQTPFKPVLTFIFIPSMLAEQTKTNTNILGGILPTYINGHLKGF